MVAKNERSAGGTLVLVALAASLVVGACGTVRAASVGTTGTTRTAQVVRDPDNPYFTGAVGSTSASGARVIHDPDNAAWTGATATEIPYADPIRGPR